MSDDRYDLYILMQVNYNLFVTYTDTLNDSKDLADYQGMPY